MTARAPQVEPVKHIEPGVNATAILVQRSTGALVTPQQVFLGECFGFIFTPVGSNSENGGQSPVIFCNVRGFGTTGNDNVPIVPNHFYDLPCTGLQIVASPDGVTEVCGTWLVTTVLKPYIGVRPVKPYNPSDAPAASGGNPPARELLETQIATVVAPAQGSADGLLIGDASMYKAMVRAIGGGTFTGGTLDIWRRGGSGAYWYLASQVPLTVGQDKVQIPVDYMGPHEPTDRIWAILNGLTLTAGNTADVILVLQ